MLKRTAMVLLLVALSLPAMAWNKTSALPDRVSQLELVPASPNLIFAVTATALYRSSDAGVTWKSAGITGHMQLAVNPRNSKIYALVADENAGVRKITLLLSRDTGKSFGVQATLDPTGNLVPRKIFLDPFRPVRLYGVGPQGQALVSLDDGKKWRALRAPDGIHYDQVHVSPLNSDALYLTGRRIAGGDSVLFISHDVGKTYDLLSLRPTACEPQEFYDDPFFARILVATCEGTKTLATHGIKTSSGLKRVTSIVSVPKDFAHLLALNERPNATGTNLWITANGGKSWKMVDSLTGKITSVVVLNTQEKWVVAGTLDGSVYRQKLSAF